MTAAKHRRSVPPACPASQGEGTVSRPTSALDGGGHALPFVILTAASTHRETTKKHAPNPALFTKYTTKLSVCTPPTYRQPSPRLDTRPKFPSDFTKSVLSPPPFRAIINYYYYHRSTRAATVLTGRNAPILRQVPWQYGKYSLRVFSCLDAFLRRQNCSHLPAMYFRVIFGF